MDSYENLKNYDRGVKTTVFLHQEKNHHSYLQKKEIIQNKLEIFLL